MPFTPWPQHERDRGETRHTITLRAPLDLTTGPFVQCPSEARNIRMQQELIERRHGVPVRFALKNRTVRLVAESSSGVTTATPCFAL